MFLIDLENAAGKEIPLLEEDDGYNLGFILQNERVISLRLYYLYDLQTIPDSLGNLEALEKLIITYNDSLNSIPESIGDLKDLKVLKLDNNNLKTFPDTIGNLISL